MSALTEMIPTAGYVCKKCGHVARNKQALGSHWRYSHPKRKAVKRVPKKSRPSVAQAPALAEHIAYLAGKVETLLEYYARGNGLPESALAGGVASFIQHQARRPVLGTQHRVPGV